MTVKGAPGVTVDIDHVNADGRYTADTAGI